MTTPAPTPKWVSLDATSGTLEERAARRRAFLRVIDSTPCPDHLALRGEACSLLPADQYGVRQGVVCPSRQARAAERTSTATRGGQQRR